VAALVVMSLVAAFKAPWVVSIRLDLFDQYQRFFPRERASFPAVIVGIDEHALSVAGQWPWPRSKVAELLDRINAMQPLAVGFDITFSEPDRLSLATVAAQVRDLPPDVAARLSALPSNDALLAESLKAAPSVLAVAGEPDPDPRALPVAAPSVVIAPNADALLRRFAGHQQSLPELSAAAHGQALINSDSIGGIIRTAPLLARVGGGTLPTLSLDMWRVATGTTLAVGMGEDGLMSVQFGDQRVPAQADGTMWIRFGRFDRERVVSAGEILNGRANPEMFANKLVLIGVTGIGLLDYKTTPLGEFIPGVDIHTQMIEQIFDGTYLTRPAWALWSEIAALLALGALLIGLVPRLTAGKSLALLAGSLFVLAVAGAAAFRFAGLLVDVAWPMLGVLAVAGLVLADTLASSERARRQLREQAARMSGELNAAKRIQMGLLPNPQDVFVGERRFTVAALLEPARTVGGDFYDCFMLDADRLFFIVADVSGKGLPAALFMAAVKSHIKSAALQTHDDIAGIVRQAQVDIARENPELLFVTAFAGVLDARNGRLEYINAGHEPPYVRRPGGTTFRLELAGGPPLGTMDAFEYPHGERTMVPGEWLCVVTDGVTEAMNSKLELFTAAKLKDVLDAEPVLEWPTEVVKRSQEAVRVFSAGADPADDLTLLAVRWG
jgi:adenylate cyclase